MAAIGEFLVTSGLMADFEEDFDDNYEWIEGDGGAEAVQFNVWRKLGDDEYWEFEPVHVYTMYDNSEPADELIENIAGIIAEGLDSRVSLGTVKNVAGEEYCYREDQVVAPCTVANPETARD